MCLHASDLLSTYLWVVTLPLFQKEKFLLQQFPIQGDKSLAKWSQLLTHCILVDSSTDIFWMSLFGI